MFARPDPLISGNSTHDLYHPLIRLAYAYEIQSKEIAMEALTLAAIHYESFPAGSSTEALLPLGILQRPQSPHSKSFPVATRTVD